MNIVVCRPSDTQPIMNAVNCNYSHVVLDIDTDHDFGRLVSSFLLSDFQLTALGITGIDFKLIDYIGAKSVNIVYSSGQGLSSKRDNYTRAELEEFIYEKTKSIC